MLPAYAGMIRESDELLPLQPGAPRVCGDDPHVTLPTAVGRSCSPRMRG